jgi:cell division protein FtsN
VLSGRAVQIGLITGLLAFLIGAAVVTASELALFDDSIGNRKSRTTLVGGASKERPRDVEATPTPDPADPSRTATPEATPEESPPREEKETPTPTPTATPTPTPGAAAPTPTPAPPGGSRAPERP